MSGEEFYEFEQMLVGLDEETLLLVAGIVGVVLLVVGLFLIVGYIFQSIGLYTIAKRRGIANPWLAWLPVGDAWIAGSIADQYQYVVNGAVNNKRKILLALSIGAMIISGMSSTLGVGTMVEGQSAAEQMVAFGSMLSLLQSGVNLAYTVFWHWSLYDLYGSCKPKNNVLFLVLGIVFGFLPPFFIFACRNKEEGMPPRREEPQCEYQPEPRTYKEPWENV